MIYLVRDPSGYYEPVEVPLRPTEPIKILFHESAVHKEVEWIMTGPNF